MRHHRRLSTAVSAALLALVLLLGGCGGDDDEGAGGGGADTASDESGGDAIEGDDSADGTDAEGEGGADTDAGADADEATEPTATPEPTPEPTATPVPVEPFRILVTNDDGVGSDGIDALVQALLELPDVEVTVIAPAENASGSSDNRVEGEVTWSDTTTASGYPAVAVAGLPADSVFVAFEELLEELPHLVVSGSNDGENIGPFAQVSGTVGAARTAARFGIPALAVSQGGISVEPEFADGIPIAIEWIAANRDEIQAREPGGLAPVVSINVPSCGETGDLEGAVETTLAEDFGEFVAFAVDCSVEVDPIVTDVDAFFSGYAAITLLPEALVAGEAAAEGEG